MKKEMRAAKFNKFNGPKGVEVGTMEVPELKEGEILVKIKAAGVNPVDAVITKGYYKDMMPHPFPVIPGWD
ncbi:alcohol dehydrogenase catalytic domain-containing protein, partial [Tamlana crocina]|nr:NADP-dependent oxidoreductase [Tamlana crocina]